MSAAPQAMIDEALGVPGQAAEDAVTEPNPLPPHLERAVGPLSARLLDALPVAVLGLDRDLRCRYVNTAVHEVLGWSPEQILGKRAAEAGLDPEAAADLEAACREVLTSGTPSRHGLDIDTPRGVHFLEMRLLPQLDAAGHIESLLAVTMERPERRHGEAGWSPGEASERALLAQLRDHAVFAVDLRGRATTWNEGVEHVTGWPREDFIGLPLERLFAPEDIAQGLHRKELQRAAEEGSVATDHWLRRRDGTLFFATGATSRLIDAMGHVVGFSKVVRDRTAWKLAEEERERLLESERKARQQAETAGRSKDEFFAALSHELRSPLNAIVGWVHVLRSRPGASSEVLRGLEVIERNARAEAGIIDDLVDTSRVMAGEIELHVREVSVRQIVTAALDAIGPAARAKRLELTMALDPAVDRIRADPHRLQQALGHLLGNAVKFTPESGRVTISSVRDDTHFELRVCDSGAGIASTFLPFVFDRFRRGESSVTRLHAGRGLGLALVKSLMDLHGGSVRCQSAGEGRGATFALRLPLPPERADAPAEPLAPLPAFELASLPRLEGTVALVVDDEVDSLVFCGRLLEERGAKVLLAIDAEQALEQLGAERVDILVSDVGMAGADGYHLIARVRALTDQHVARIPAIAVTAYARAEDRQRLLLAGFQMHISKPIEPQELIAGIASLLGVTAPKDAPQSPPKAPR